MGYTTADTSTAVASSRPTSELRTADRIVRLCADARLIAADESIPTSADPADLHRLLDAAAMLGDAAAPGEALVLAASWIVRDEMRFG